ncbi:MAG: hypothetical protein J7L99_07390 [Planctomycetes bacterium]|nr:hypothetical protein [Planctomycetota bacterium]
MSNDAIRRNIPPQTPIKPWLILGPFYRDLSNEVKGVSLFEADFRTNCDNGRETLQRCISHAEPILLNRHREGDNQGYLGHPGTWQLVRRDEPVLMWGEYFIRNHLCSAFLTTLVKPTKPGKTLFKLVLPITSYGVIYLNGKKIFDTDKVAFISRKAVGWSWWYDYEFHANLKSGDNVLNIGLFRIARNARVGFGLKCNRPLTAQIPIADGMSYPRRAKIEQDLRAIRLERDLFYDSDTVGVHISKPFVSDAHLRLQLVQDDKKLRSKTARRPCRVGLVKICKGANLPNGQYSLVCELIDKSGKTIMTTTFDIVVLRPTPPMRGYKRLARRKRIALRHFAQQNQEGPMKDIIWSQVALYALGEYEKIDQDAILQACKFVAEWNDCADFAIQGLIRLAYWDKNYKRLNPSIRDAIKDTLLGFKYWVDEPGETVMYMNSENHRILFHVAEYLAGQLYPTAEFTNSRQRGLFHIAKARMFIMEWLRQRGRFGFDEWHSNAYYPVTLSALLNLYDFANYNDCKLRLLTRNVLHYMLFNLAADTFEGVFGTAHARSYTNNLKYPDLEHTAAVCWLLFGRGSLHGGSGMATVPLASSDYELPELIYKIASDRKKICFSRQQQGILPGPEPSANFVVYKTPDYMLSAVQDYCKGHCEPSLSVGQVTLADKTVVFLSCPYTSGEGSGLRPDYWAGNAVLPRAVQYHNVLAITWRLNDITWMTHCFFEQEKFDEVLFKGNWVFARKGKGYLAIWSQNGMKVADCGQYAGRELICYARENTWLIECGREANWGDFKNFVHAVSSSSIKVENDRIIYDSPSIGRFITGWDIQPSVAGQPVQLRDYPLLESPFGKAQYGSGEIILNYGQEKLHLHFNI